ncbi:hypothetical protein [Streptomyces sp. 604F]|uniref:hypothetical protein n=1 Tax=Streptomyces sp. 604F TaxID=1476754 RepID=UPI0013DB6BA6|nr:hypothetical protein [Streptomyces sp. 604F]
MTTWLMPFVTALIGYGVHWAQTALARRHKRKDADEERIGGLLIKLAEIKDLEGDDADRAGRDLAAKVAATDAGLLRDKKLRQRVNEALFMIQALWITTGGNFRPGAIRATWASDAIRCCQAALRGDRLPRLDGLAARQLFDACSTTISTPDGHAVNAYLDAISPEYERQERRFLRWQAQLVPWWRRSPRLWGRLRRPE